jgi:hypothetical protein
MFDDWDGVGIVEMAGGKRVGKSVSPIVVIVMHLTQYSCWRCMRY